MPKVEYLCYARKEGEWLRFQLAVDGTPCVPFDVCIEDWENYRSEDEANAFLVRQAQGLIDSYGDARYTREL